MDGGQCRTRREELKGWTSSLRTANPDPQGRPMSWSRRPSWKPCLGRSGDVLATDQAEGPRSKVHTQERTREQLGRRWVRTHAEKETE